MGIAQILAKPNAWPQADPQTAVAQGFGVCSGRIQLSRLKAKQCFYLGNSFWVFCLTLS